MRNVFLVFFMIVFANCIFAQKTVDVIYFKSGNIVRGKIKEIFFETIKIKTTQGSIYIFNTESISKVGREFVNKQRSIRIPKILIFAGGGYTIPINDSEFSNTDKSGPGVNFGLGYKLNKILALKLDVQYNNLTYKDKRQSGEISIGAVKYIEKTCAKSFSTLKLELMLHNPVNLINPYGVIGAGAYFLQKDGSYNYRTNFGFSIGGGFSLRLLQNHIYLFAEAQCNYNFTSESEKAFIPIKCGLLLLPVFDF